MTEAGKSQRVKTQRVKTSENFAEEKMFAEDISEDFSEDQISLLLDFRVFLDIFQIFAEDWFLLRSFRKFLPSGFVPLSRFQRSIRKSYWKVTETEKKWSNSFCRTLFAAPWSTWNHLFQVRIRSKSCQNQVRVEGFRWGRVGPAGRQGAL